MKDRSKERKPVKGKNGRACGEGPRPASATGEIAAELHGILDEFLRTHAAALEAAGQALAAAVRAGRKVLVFGNGGSAAEAQHFAAELVNGLARREAPPLAAIALTADTSALTAIGNDRGFDFVFGRQIEALGLSGDVALALTTSGMSANVLEGLKAARSKELITIALTGENTSRIAPLAKHLLDVPSRSTPRIQEAHLFILHFLAGGLEKDAA
jgi:D-sedoheptulose 7-phosphate isomerase